MFLSRLNKAYGFGGGRPQIKMPFSSHPIKRTCYQPATWRWWWSLAVVFVRFLHRKIASFSLSILSSLEEVTMPIAHRVTSPHPNPSAPLGWSSYLRLGMGDLCLLPHLLTYPIIHFYHGLTNVYTLGSNPILLYFIAQTVPVLATGNLLLMPVSLCYTPMRVFSLFECFLTFCHIRCTRLIGYIPCSSPRISYFPTEPWWCWKPRSGYWVAVSF